MMESFMKKIALDTDTGMFDHDQIQTGVSSSARSGIETLKGIIAQLEQETGRVIPIDDISLKAREHNMDEQKVDELIAKLNEKGDVFYPKRGHLSRT